MHTRGTRSKSGSAAMLDAASADTGAVQSGVTTAVRKPATMANSLPRWEQQSGAQWQPPGAAQSDGMAAPDAERPVNEAATAAGSTAEQPATAQRKAASASPLDPDTPPRSPADAEAPLRRKRQRTQPRRPPAPQHPPRLQRSALPQDSSALHGIIADALPVAVLARLESPSDQQTALQAPVAAAVSLGTLGPPPLPLFVTPADGITTRRRPLPAVPHASSQPAGANAAHVPASLGDSPPLSEQLLQLSPQQHCTRLHIGHPSTSSNRLDGAAAVPNTEDASASSPPKRQRRQRSPPLKPAVKKEESPPSSSKRSRRVSFAPGPLPGTADGHPPHEGVQTATRAVGAPPLPPLDAGLTPAHVHTLEAELGGENQWSVNRLKRRGGLLPPLRRERVYATPQPCSTRAATHARQHAAIMEQLQRVPAAQATRMQAAMRIAIAAAHAAGQRAISSVMPPAQRQSTSSGAGVHAAGAAQRVASRNVGASRSSGVGGSCEAAQQGASASQTAGGDAGASGTAAEAAAARSTRLAPRLDTSGGFETAAPAVDALPDAHAAVAEAPAADAISAGTGSSIGRRSSSRHAPRGCPAAAAAEVVASPVAAAAEALASPVAAAAAADVNPVSPPAPVWRQHGHAPVPSPQPNATVAAAAGA